MALRSLMIELGLADDVSNKLRSIDRRLRQTFDRHAELYFARQRRRAAL